MDIKPVFKVVSMLAVILGLLAVSIAAFLYLYMLFNDCLQKQACVYFHRAKNLSDAWHWKKFAEAEELATFREDLVEKIENLKLEENASNLNVSDSDLDNIQDFVAAGNQVQ